MVEERGRALFDRTSEDPPCLIFEWMDQDLWNVRAEPYRENKVLPKAIAKSALKSTRSVRIGECDAYRLALSATG